MKQRGFAPIIILFFAALVAVGYIGYKNYWPTPTFTSTPSPTASATSDPTVNWETYNNSKHHFQIQYPNNWELTEDTGKATVNGINFNKDLITILNNETTPSIEIDFANPFYKDIQDLDNKNESSLKISGYNTYLAEEFDEGGGSFSHYYIAKESKIIAVLTTATYPEDEYNGDGSKFYKILSTFKFTDQSNTEEKFCGGFAGVSCPAGYKCQLDGKYPDAGGVCVKN